MSCLWACCVAKLKATEPGCRVVCYTAAFATLLIYARNPENLYHLSVVTLYFAVRLLFLL